MFTYEHVAALLHYTARIAGVEECTVLTEPGGGMQFGSFVVQFPQDSVASLKIPSSSGVDCFSAEHVVLLCNALRHHVDGELSEEHDTDGADEDPEAFDLSLLKGRVIALYEIVGETEIRVHFNDGATLVMRAPNAVLADASLDLEPGVRIGEMYERTSERSRWHHKRSLKIVDDGRTYEVFFIAKAAPPQVSYELREPRTDVHTHEGNVPPLHEWFGIQGVVRNLDVLETLFAARDRAMTKKIAEDLDREIMAEVDEDTRTLPAPWRDPAEEWPEDGERFIAAYQDARTGARTVTQCYAESGVIKNRLGEPVAEVDVYTNYILNGWMPLPAHPLDNDEKAS